MTAWYRKLPRVDEKMVLCLLQWFHYY